MRKLYGSTTISGIREKLFELVGLGGAAALHKPGQHNEEIARVMTEILTEFKDLEERLIGLNAIIEDVY